MPRRGGAIGDLYELSAGVRGCLWCGTKTVADCDGVSLACVKEIPPKETGKRPGGGSGKKGRGLER